MKNNIGTLLLVALMMLLFAACGPSPSVDFEANTTLLTEAFDSPDAWETYATDTVSIGAVDGVYRMDSGPGGYIWGLNEESHQDIIIEVETNLLSAHRDNAYGVMCRANPENNGEGYYFLISGDGYWAIGRGELEGLNPLVEWRKHYAIRGDKNAIRAICLGQNLILYVNDTYMGEFVDEMYTEGVTGFAAAAFTGGDISVTFDNLTLQSVQETE